ncbi:MAG: PLP-dependent lyase/thiolase [Candidatus Shapirobacteria bacterium]
MTPLIKLDNIYLKREDLNETGSAKDRAISVQVQNLIKEGFTKAVISSTGNAAISAIHFCKLNNIDLTVFLSPKIDPQKLKEIKSQIDQVQFSLKPISDAFKFAKKNNAYYLRQSTDPTALIGYQAIGRELLEQCPQITSIFVPVGSGTTLLGISQALSNVKVFSVKPKDTTLTDALTVKFQPLKNRVISAVKDSNGSELIIQNEDIISSQKFLEKNNIQTSNESALALAGYYKAIKNNIDCGQHPVILLTGAKR